MIGTSWDRRFPGCTVMSTLVLHEVQPRTMCMHAETSRTVVVGGQEDLGRSVEVRKVCDGYSPKFPGHGSADRHEV